MLLCSSVPLTADSLCYFVAQCLHTVTEDNSVASQVLCGSSDLMKIIEKSLMADVSTSDAMLLKVLTAGTVCIGTYVRVHYFKSARASQIACQNGTWEFYPFIFPETLISLESLFMDLLFLFPFIFILYCYANILCPLVLISCMEHYCHHHFVSQQ